MLIADSPGGLYDATTYQTNEALIHAVALKQVESYLI